MTPKQLTLQDTEFDYREQYKALYDFFKHLTTLSTGSILLLATLLKDLFKTPKWSILVAASFVCFALTILGAVFSMLIFGSLVVQRRKPPEGVFTNILSGVIVCTGLMFVAAVLGLVVFALKNLT